MDEIEPVSEAADMAEPPARPAARQPAQKPATPRRRELVVCSLEAWDQVWRRNQFLVRELLRRDPGLRVLFVEPPLDLPHSLSQRRRPLPPGLRPVPGQDRLWSLRPLKPLPRVAGPFADQSLGWQVRRAATRLGFTRPTLWVNDVDYARLAVQTAWPTLYDVTDDWLAATSTPRGRRRLARNEAVLLHGADAVVVCSPGLAASRGADRPVHLIPNAVDIEPFTRPRPRPVDLPPEPSAVYVGTLHEDRLDVALCEELAARLPHLHIVLVGPDALAPASSTRLVARPNVHVLGPRPHDDVPAYLQHADVLVVPHVVTPFTESLDPIKAYECLAVGTPTVATPVAGFREKPEQFVVAEPSRFVDAVAAVLASPPPRPRAPTDMPGWSERAERFAAVLEEVDRRPNRHRPGRAGRPVRPPVRLSAGAPLGQDLGAVLVACLDEATGPVDLDAAADLSNLALAAQHHGIAPAVHRALGARADLPDDVRTALELASRHQWQVHLRALADLAELVPLLDGIGVPWAVVKGPMLVESIYGRVDVRSYVDLDLVVDPRSLPVVLDALESDGARLFDRNWAMIRHQVRGELSLTLRHGTMLDLHWHVFNERRLRQAFTVSMTDLLSRTVRVDLNGIAVRTFDPNDTLVYLAARTAVHGGYRLVWLKDLERVIARHEVDWEEVVSRARSMRLALPVAAMLARARRVVGAAVPVEVLDELAPAWGWRGVIAATDRLSPPQRSFGRQLTARTIVAATRRSGTSSLVELGRAAIADVLKPVLTDARHPWRRRLLHQGPAEQSSANLLYFPGGDVNDREAYLRLVSEGVDP